MDGTDPRLKMWFFSRERTTATKSTLLDWEAWIVSLWSLGPIKTSTEERENVFLVFELIVEVQKILGYLKLSDQVTNQCFHFNILKQKVTKEKFRIDSFLDLIH